MQRKSTLSQLPAATFLGVMLGILMVELAEAAVVVYNSHAELSVTLGGYDGRYGDLSFPTEQALTYSGKAITHIELGLGSLSALSHYGTSWGSSSTSFTTEVRSQVEGFFTRDAEADAFWEFAVTDSDTTFRVDAVGFLAAFSWSLQDLTLDSRVAGGAQLGGNYGGAVFTGTLMQGHNYRLVESTRSWGSSDERATVAFSVGTDVVFAHQPDTIIAVPDSGGFLTNAAFVLAVGSMGWWRRRNIRLGEA